ncbi:MAG: hypothetical protein H0T82_00450 [Sphingomonas sp.]|nr:hypothetical protein [Sphingomonas sp.]
MARRPIFLPTGDSRNLVSDQFVEFEWFPGMSLKQKQRSVEALHTMARHVLGVSHPLEVSSKSPDELGVRLSSFNLKFTTQRGRALTVEAAFQGSKVFARGGPFRDLFDMSPREAKRDTRLRDSGALVAFSFFGVDWPLEPPTAFYDWLYINALIKNEDLAAEVRLYDAFTDIEFNPEKSVNCQARSVALYCSLARVGELSTLETPETFRAIHKTHVSEPRHLNYHNPLV